MCKVLQKILDKFLVLSTNIQRLGASKYFDPSRLRFPLTSAANRPQLISVAFGSFCRWISLQQVRNQEFLDFSSIIMHILVN